MGNKLYHCSFVSGQFCCVDQCKFKVKVRIDVYIVLTVTTLKLFVSLEINLTRTLFSRKMLEKR